jgi:hypothetical protein
MATSTEMTIVRLVDFQLPFPRRNITNLCQVKQILFLVHRNDFVRLLTTKEAFLTVIPLLVPTIGQVFRKISRTCTNSEDVPPVLRLRNKYVHLDALWRFTLRIAALVGYSSLDLLVLLHCRAEPSPSASKPQLKGFGTQTISMSLDVPVILLRLPATAIRSQ